MASSMIESPLISSPSLYRFIDTCPLCGSAQNRLIHEEKNDLPKNDSRFDSFRDDQVFLKECLSCTFAFVDKLPIQSDYYEAIYTNLKPDWETEFKYHGKKEINQDIKKCILKYKQGGRLLDIGCWAGAWIAEMSDCFSVRGIELNPDGVASAQKRGLQVERSSIADVALEENSLDVITMIDVLEHLPHPGKVLEKSTRALKTGGVIYIKVPNYPGQLRKQELLRKAGLTEVGIMQNYVHINHFNRKSLSSKLRTLGFDVVESGFTQAETWDLSAPQSATLKVKRWFRNTVFKLVTGALNRVTEWTGIELALNLYVVAVKR